ncbi:hypothetical protein [Staphylococcus phage vB_StaM_SA1]|nr:hypothetical protein [Staphylococcus phage vB_StaM_SA1]
MFFNSKNRETKVKEKFRNLIQESINIDIYDKEKMKENSYQYFYDPKTKSIPASELFNRARSMTRLNSNILIYEKTRIYNSMWHRHYDETITFRDNGIEVTLKRVNTNFGHWISSSFIPWKEYINIKEYESGERNGN